MHRQLKLKQVTQEEYRHKVWLCRDGQGGAGTESGKVGREQKEGLLQVR